MWQQPTEEQEERLRERWRLVGVALLNGLAMLGCALSGQVPENVLVGPDEYDDERAA